MGERVAMADPHTARHRKFQVGMCHPALGDPVEAGTQLTQAALPKQLYEEVGVRAPEGSPSC